MHELTAHGGSYRMEASGIVAHCLARGNPYEPQLLEHIYEQRFRGLAVDAGAHIGNHTIWLAVVCRLDVIAFEPLGSHKMLQRNIALNGLTDQVRVEPVALGATEGFATRVGKGRLRAGVGDIPLRRLDDYELTNVSLIKADVEGMEPEVFRGGEQTIRREQPVIFAEARDSSAHDANAAALEPMGYEMTLRIKTPTPVERWDAK